MEEGNCQSDDAESLLKEMLCLEQLNLIRLASCSLCSLCGLPTVQCLTSRRLNLEVEDWHKCTGEEYEVLQSGGSEIFTPLS